MWRLLKDFCEHHRSDYRGLRAGEGTLRGSRTLYSLDNSSSQGFAASFSKEIQPRKETLGK